MIDNTSIQLAAKNALKGNMKLPIITVLLMLSITIIPSLVPGVGFFAGLIISGPLMLGYILFFLAFMRKQETRVGMLFDGFAYFVNAFVGYILMVIFTLLWTLLLIVPGIVASLSYSMMFYILADDPTLDGYTALSKSKAMMMGHKKQLFYLICRFIGWMVLCILTLGILFLWVGPYFQCSMTIFYEELKKEPRVISN